MTGRRCPIDRCPVILTDGERYCTTHAREYEQRRGSQRSRGYGTKHERLRKHWQRRIDAGDIVHCPTCGTRITGTTWQLGHDHNRPGLYLGPQCTPCNTSDGGRRGAQVSSVTRAER